MKRIFTILFVMLGLMASKAYAEALTTPDPAKTYNIVHSSKLLLSVDGNSLKIMNIGDALQKFTVEVFGTTEEGATIYNIKSESGKYVGSDKGYTHVFLEDPADPYAQYTIWESHEADHVKLYNVGRGAYMGSDNNNAGSGVYSDKPGTDGKHAWAFVEARDGVVYDVLETAIANAEAVVAEAVVGTTPGSYPQSAIDELNAAIAAAKALLSSQDQKEVNEGGQMLNNAVTSFYTQRIVFLPESGSKYYFFNTATSTMMALQNNEAKIATITGADDQKWEIIPVEGSNNAFYLKNGENFLARKGGWNTTATTDNSANETRFELEPVDLEEAVYRIKKYNEWGYMATDEMTPGALVYTNKGASITSTWQILKVVEGEILTIGLDKAIENAETILAGAEVGDQPWNYPQEAKNALEAAIASARAAEFTSQEEVNAVIETLSEAVDAFESARVLPWFQPRENTAYRFSINKYESKYMTSNGSDAKAIAEFAAGNTAQHWTFQEVARNTFILKNDGKVLDYDGNMVSVQDADAPRWMTVYTNTRNNIDYFALVKADDPTSVMTFSGGNNMAFQSLDKGNIAHQGRMMRVDAANDPNLGMLEIAIATAKNTLKNIDRGNAVGQWSDAKCDAFQAEIDKAEALAGISQEEADAATEALNKARTEFVDNPNTVIKDNLEAAIAAGREKAAGAEVGVEIGQYYMSAIEAFQALMDDYEAQAGEVSEQEACDALTAEVEQAIEDFKGNTEVQPVADVLNDYVMSCEALYEAEKDNVGDNQGQRPQEVIDAFKSAIDAAKAISTPVVADLQGLIDARNAFVSGAVAVDRTPLRNAIAKAEGEAYQNLVAGDFQGQYSQEAIDGFNEALAAAKEVEADKSKTQEEVAAAATALTEAMKTLDKALVTIDFQALDAAIATAKASLAKVTVIGDAEGECPKAVVDALSGAIAAAEGMDRAAVNQGSVDAEVTRLAEATSTFTTAVIASTGLDASIAAAQALIDDATVGMTPGDYPQSAIGALESAIASAQAVLDGEASAQADMIAAVASLKDAIETFKGAVIPAHDLTDINALIASAEAFVAAGCDDDLVAMYLEAAKDVVADADNQTKNDIKKAYDNLYKALTLAGWVAGIEGVNAEGVDIRTANGVLNISGLPQGALVNVYGLDGRLVAAEKAQGEVVISLMAGRYVVAVAGEGVAFNRVVVVR